MGLILWRWVWFMVMGLVYGDGLDFKQWIWFYGDRLGFKARGLVLWRWVWFMMMGLVLR